MKKRHNEKWENDKTSSRQVMESYRASLDKEFQDDSDCSLALPTYRGTQVEFDLGIEYSNSKDPLDRTAGAYLLGQLGWGDQCFLEESVDALIPLLSDNDVRVICAAGFALGHRMHSKAVPPLSKLVEHPDEEVRYSVVHGLLGLEDSLAIDCLIRFSQDPDSDVRDWSLMGLGTLIEIDTPKIRETLFHAIQDADYDARCEAILGLAIRGDKRVVDILLIEMERDSIGQMIIEAAEEIADPSLHSKLVELSETLEMDGDESWRAHLDSAIRACK